MSKEALPEFFQTTGNTLLDQLDDFEIGGVDDMDIQKSKVLVNDELTIESLNVLNFGIGEPKSNNNSDVVALDEHLSEPLRSIPETPPLVRPYHPPNSSMMKSSDLRFVLSRVFQPLQCADPFSDDFYFIQLNTRKSLASRQKRRGSTEPQIYPRNIPLPTWRDTKMRIRSQLADSQQELSLKTREWASKEQVLGIQPRAQATRPRELLSMPISWDFTTENDNDVSLNGFSDPGAPAFSSRLWAMRRAVQRGYEALDTVSELDILLQVPAIWSTQEAREEVLEEVDNAVNLLAQSLGIRGLGLTSADLAIDGALAAALLQSVKGKRLIARSFPLLPPEKKWLLVQPMLARVLQASSSSNVPSIEETQADASLCTALIAFFSQARNHATTLRQKDQDSADATRPMPESEPFWFVLASQLLAHCRVTVKSVLVGFLGPNRESLLKALQLTGDTGLGDAGKVRLDVLRALLATGDKMLGLMLSVQGTGVQDLEEKLQEWKQTKDALLSLLGASN